MQAVIANALDLDDRVMQVFEDAESWTRGRTLQVVAAAGSNDEMAELDLLLTAIDCEVVARVNDSSTLCRQVLRLKPDIVIANANGKTETIRALIHAIHALTAAGILPAVLIEGSAVWDLIGDGMLRKLNLPADPIALLALAEKAMAFQREVVELGEDYDH